MNPIDLTARLAIQADAADLAPTFSPQADAGGTKDASFQDLLTGLVDKVNSMQKDADASIRGLATGEVTDVHTVAVKMQEAGVAFELMMQIRNKLLDAYQEIIKMQP